MYGDAKALPYVVPSPNIRICCPLALVRFDLARHCLMHCKLSKLLQPAVTPSMENAPSSPLTRLG